MPNIPLIFDSFAKALGQWDDPRFRGILVRGLAIAVVVLIVSAYAMAQGILWMIGDTIWIPLFGEVTWLATALSTAAIGSIMAASVFLMTPIAAFIIGFLLDDVAEAVESKHYHHLPQVESMPLAEALKSGLSFAFVFIGMNIVAFFLAFIFTPLIFPVVNGYLLSREYMQLVAQRRMPVQEAEAFRRAHRGTTWFAGICMAVPLSIPIVNLVIPIFGAATFTHLFHRLKSPQTD